MKVVAVVVCLSLLAEMVLGATVEQATVAAHNKARREEAKAKHAANLYELEWDVHLARAAQNWADACVYEHEYSNHGENLYVSSPKSFSDDAYLQIAVDDWMRERSFNTDNSFDCCFSGTKTSTCCHYSQVVSARSTRVGCGVATCAQLTKNNQVVMHNAAYVVCYYEPRGNLAMNGQHAAYVLGTPCSHCHGGYTCHDGLCAKTA